MAGHNCKIERCAGIADKGRSYCAKHADREQPHRHNIRRDKKDPFYDSPEWRSLRLAALQRDGYRCQECKRRGRLTAANIGDHIITRKSRPDLELDIENIEALCSKCHNRKRQSER